jgi:ethanolamine utilization protein EutA
VDGRIVSLTAVEAGARLVVTDAAGRITRLEPFGAAALGAGAGLGQVPGPAALEALAEGLADRIMLAVDGRLDEGLRRLPQMSPAGPLDGVVVAGGVSEYVFGTTRESFGDIGPDLARALRKRLDERGLRVLAGKGGIRATVVGASQYKVQVSGSTVYLDPMEALPLRNLATIRPDLFLGEEIDTGAVSRAVTRALRNFDLADGAHPVAVAVDWRGSAGYHRLDALARGLVQGLAPVLAAGHPLCIVMTGDIGGLLGIHCREEELTPNPIVSIDGVDLEAFDFIDIGEVIRSTGAVPVVIKSLIFPAEGAERAKEAVA